MNSGETLPDGYAEIRAISISGNKEGLIDLAKAILSLAMSEDVGHHIHIDDLHASNVRSPQEYELILSRIG